MHNLIKTWKALSNGTDQWTKPFTALTGENFSLTTPLTSDRLFTM